MHDITGPWLRSRHLRIPSRKKQSEPATLHAGLPRCAEDYEGGQGPIFDRERCPLLAAGCFKRRDSRLLRHHPGIKRVAHARRTGKPSTRIAALSVNQHSWVTRHPGTIPEGRQDGGEVARTAGPDPVVHYKRWKKPLRGRNPPMDGGGGVQKHRIFPDDPPEYEQLFARIPDVMAG